MIKPRIIVTGATGKTGSAVVSELLKADYPVRAMVHREDRRSAQLKAQGAEIVVADVSDAALIARRLAGNPNFIKKQRTASGVGMIGLGVYVAASK